MKGKITDVEKWREEVATRIMRVEILVWILFALEGIRYGLPVLAKLIFP